MLSRSMIVATVVVASLTRETFSATDVAGEQVRLAVGIETRISPVKEEFLIGEPICLRMDTLNLRGETVYILDNQGHSFDFTARNSSGQLAKDTRPTQISILSTRVPIPAGRDVNDVIFLNEYLGFPAPGVYTVAYKAFLPVYQRDPSASRERASEWIPVSGSLTVKLRKGSAAELESHLREYVKQLETGEGRLQSQAARALTDSEPALAVQLLKQAIEPEGGKYPSCTTFATWALSKIDTEEAIRALLAIAGGNGHRGVRAEAVRHLGRSHVQQVAPVLVKLLSDPDVVIRIDAVRSLGNTRDRRYLRDIESLLSDSDQAVRKAAREAYDRLMQADDARPNPGGKSEGRP